VTVAVLGPGAIGGALAVRLARAGERVVCVARPETAELISRDGLSLVQDGDELHARPDAQATLSEPVDLLLVSVKAYDLAAALERVTAEPAFVLPLLNGLEHMPVLRRRFAKVAAATIGRLEAYRDGATRIVQHEAAVVTVAADAQVDPLVRAGVEVRVDGGEQDVLWEKLARQAPLALLTALTRAPVGELRDDPRLRALVAEACAVAAADGAATTFDEQWRIVQSLPARLTTSTARDVAAGRPSELDAIAGGVVRTGRRVGVPTPVFQELLAECREP
jgi:2-dehydropantoate 2-reductase